MAEKEKNKDALLQDTLKQIEKQYGKGSIMKLGDRANVDIDAISSGSIAIDYALGIGGYPKGRIIEIYGPESSGKTTLALHAIAECQKAGGRAAFIDAENAIDPMYAKNLGVKIDDLILSQPDSGEQALEITEMLIKSGAIDLIVIDSVAALVPQAELDGEMGDSQVGLQARLMSKAMRKLAEQYPVLDRPLYSPPKPVLASELMSYANIGGMFFPFTMESNINVDNPFFVVPWTMTHELAHQCGFMREDEANFIAYLACKQSDDALMRYSGYLLAYDNAVSALRKVDPEAAKAIGSGLSAAVRRDLAQRAEHWAQYEGPIQDVSNAANDTYLKANDQADGMRSYGRMVDLLLAEQRAEGEGA